MSQEKPSTADDVRQWWLSVGEAPEGPHSESYILVGVKTGKIPASALVCPVGGQHWKPMTEWPEFAGACAASPAPPSPPPLPPRPATTASTLLTTLQQKAPWNPRTIGLLGILLSPLWAGIMAALNTRRLSLALPVWRPLAIGIGATALDIFVPFESYLFSLTLYGSALFAIWKLDLSPQEAAWGQCKQADSKANWLVPCLAGSPAALLVIFGFLIYPLLPASPREVCQEFLATDTADEARQYVTTNMYPFIEQLKRIEKFADQLPGEDDAEPDYDMFELTDEGYAPPDVGGYFVGCRTFIPGDDGNSLLLDGYFHLADFTSDWKIDEWYITSVNGEPVDQGRVSMIGFWKSIADEMQKEIDSETRLARSENTRKHNGSMYNYGMDAVRDTTRSSSGSVSRSDDSARTDETDQQDSRPPWQHPGLFVALKGFFVGGGAKKLGALILAALAGLAGLARWLGHSDRKP